MPSSSLGQTSLSPFPYRKGTLPQHHDLNLQPTPLRMADSHLQRSHLRRPPSPKWRETSEPRPSPDSSSASATSHPSRGRQRQRVTESNDLEARMATSPTRVSTSMNRACVHPDIPLSGSGGLRNPMIQDFVLFPTSHSKESHRYHISPEPPSRRHTSVTSAAISSRSARSRKTQYPVSQPNLLAIPLLGKDTSKAATSPALTHRRRASPNISLPRIYGDAHRLYYPPSPPRTPRIERLQTPDFDDPGADWSSLAMPASCNTRNSFCACCLCSDEEVDVAGFQSYLAGKAAMRSNC